MKQADLIETLLEERAEADDKFKELYSSERSRFDDGEDIRAGAH